MKCKCCAQFSNYVKHQQLTREDGQFLMSDAQSWPVIGQLWDHVTLCYGAVWLSVCLCLIGGPRTLGKTACVVAAVPWLTIIALLIAIPASGEIDFAIINEVVGGKLEFDTIALD